MIKVHVTCPDASITIHRKPNCLEAKVGPTQNVRHVIVNADNVSQELKQFRSNKHKFAAGRGRMRCI